MSGNPFVVSVVASPGGQSGQFPGRVSGPSRFRRLQASTFRARSGPLRASWTPPSTASDRLYVAFAIPTTVGDAVDRNCIRRRLRHALRLHGDLFPAGDLLVRVSAGLDRCTWPALIAALGEIAPTLSSLAGNDPPDVSFSSGAVQL